MTYQAHTQKSTAVSLWYSNVIITAFQRCYYRSTEQTDGSKARVWLRDCSTSITDMSPLHSTQTTTLNATPLMFGLTAKLHLANFLLTATLYLFTNI